MAYGPCTYSCEKLAVRDWTASAFRVIYAVVIAISLFMTAAKISGAEQLSDVPQTAPSEITGPMERTPEATQAPRPTAVPAPEDTEAPFIKDDSGKP